MVILVYAIGANKEILFLQRRHRDRDMSYKNTNCTSYNKSNEIKRTI